MYKEINSYSEYETIKGSTGLVKLGAPWCAPCKVLDQTLEDVAKETDIEIIKVNVDDLSEIAYELGVMSVPVMVLFVDGNLVSKVVGARTKEEILDEINKGRG